MAVRVQSEAQRLSSFCKLCIIYLVIFSLVIHNHFALTSYSRHTLLDIKLHCTNIAVDTEIYQLLPRSYSGPWTRVSQPDRQEVHVAGAVSVNKEGVSGAACRLG